MGENILDKKEKAYEIIARVIRTIFICVCFFAFIVGLALIAQWVFCDLENKPLDYRIAVGMLFVGNFYIIWKLLDFIEAVWKFTKK